jgi:hypothetical protein
VFPATLFGTRHRLQPDQAQQNCEMLRKARQIYLPAPLQGRNVMESFEK